MKVELNLPNILTFLRILSVPFIFFFLKMRNIPGTILAIITLLIASLTDTFDGILARKLNQVSEFGAFIDPLADKILIWGVYIVFLFKPLFPELWIFVIIIILRDVFVTFLRYYSRKKGVKFKTSFIAKTKTAVQMVFAFILMFFLLISYVIKSFFRMNETSISLIWKNSFPQFAEIILALPYFLMLLVCIFTVFTGLDYLLQYFKLRRNS
ncbi:MAG: CDP-diacylglycerol--glycerol-3-phosphate 3-phosphatidyltransferase [Brevinematia bacterium]